MYSGTLSVVPLTTYSVGWVVSRTGVAFGVVGELLWVSKEDALGRSGRDAKSTFSAGGPSTRRASISFCDSEAGLVNGFFTSLATFTMTSNVAACSAVGSKYKYTPDSYIQIGPLGYAAGFSSRDWGMSKLGSWSSSSISIGTSANP